MGRRAPLGLLILAALVTAASTLAASADNWRTYQNDRYGTTIEDMLSDDRADSRDTKLDPETGRRQFKELTDELKALYEQMKPVSPAYAAKRLNEVADRNSLLDAIRGHEAIRSSPKHGSS